MDAPESAVIAPEKPGLFEQWGIRYFHRLARKNTGGQGLQTARSDDEMVRSVNRVTAAGCLIAFVIGGISAGGSVLADLLTANASMVVHYAWIAAATLVLTIIEFTVLFLVSIRTVFSIARITGHDRLDRESSHLGAFLPNLLARAALEIPDPVRHVFGIDPLARVSKQRLLLIGLLYKIKIILSNVLAKLILKRVLGKSGVRVIATWISVPITGLWNAIVLIKVAREARLRLFGNLLAEHIATTMLTDETLARLSPRARTGCLRAVGNSVVLAQNYHPNMLLLLVRLATALGVREGNDFQDWMLFLDTLGSVTEDERCFLLDLLAVSTAFDGKLSSLERRMLPEAFKEHTEIYMVRIRRLIRLLHAGRLNEAKTLCALDFTAG